MPTRLAAAVPGGGLPSLPPAYPPSVYFPAPYSPPPFPGGEGGGPRLFHARGCAPCIPGVEPGRHRSRGANRALAGVCLRNRQLAAKPIEQPFYWRCRQPRRGGTGGDGTIRRKRRRRLRWSSPPGQIEQVPRGSLPSLLPAYPAFSCPLSPPTPFPGGEGGDQGYFTGLNPGGTGAGGVSRAGGGACPTSLARRALAAPG